MDKLTPKAPKIVNELMRGRKDAKLQRKVHKSTKNVPLQQKLLEPRLSCCTYCNKMFQDSRYLVKHMFRRHSDELLNLNRESGHKCECRELNRSSASSKVLSPSAEKEILDLKKIIEGFKFEVLKQLQLLANNYHIGDGAITVCKETSPILQEVRKLQSDENQTFYMELQELKLQCQNSEAAVQRIEENYKLSLDALRHEIIANEENRVHSNIEIQNMVKNALKIQKTEIINACEELEKKVNVLRKTLFSEIQKQNVEFETKFIELDKRHASDIERLQSYIELTIATFKSSQNDIEEKFEQHLQSYMNKILMRSKKQHHSGIHDTVGQRLSTSNLTSPKVIDDLPESSHVKISTKTPGEGIQSKQRIGNHINNPGNTTVVKSQVMSVQKNKSHKPLFLTKRVKAAVQQNPDILEALYEEISNVLESKMQSYGIEPNQKTLSDVEFEVKKRLLQNETFDLRSKYDFLNLRSLIDDLVTKKTRSHMSQSRKHKKILFANPEVIVEQQNKGHNIMLSEKQEDKNKDDITNCKGSELNGSNLKSVSNVSKNLTLKPLLKETVSEDQHKDAIANHSSQTCVKTVPEAAHTSESENDSVEKTFCYELNPKFANSSSNGSGSSSELQDVLIHMPENTINSGEVNSGKQKALNNGPLFVRRELKFNEKISGVPVNTYDSQLLLPKMFPSNSDDINDIDSRSSLESLSDFSL